MQKAVEQPAIITDYPEVKRWLGMLNAGSTRKLYTFALGSFCRHIGIGPSELLLKGESEIKLLVEDYLLFLKANAVKRAGKPLVTKIPREGDHGDPNYRISVNTIRYYMSGLKSFLDFSGKELKWRSIEMGYPKKVPTKLRAYRIDELRKMLALADRRERVTILCMVSGGLRIGAIPGIQFKHIQHIEHGLATVEVYPDSAESCYWMIISPEAVASIEDYRRYRMQLGEEITPESYLVRDMFSNKPVVLGTISRCIWELFTKCKLPKHELQPDHACRKYFNTFCINSGVNYQIKELLMGHSINLDDTYHDLTNEASVRKVIDEYLKALPELTITEEARAKLSNEIKVRNMPEIEALKAQLEAERKRVDSIKAEIANTTPDRLGEAKSKIRGLAVKASKEDEMMRMIRKLTERIEELEQVRGD